MGPAINYQLDIRQRQVSWFQLDPSPRQVVMKYPPMISVSSTHSPALHVVTYSGHFISDGPDCTIDPAWLDRVSEVVQMITSNNLYTIDNSHHDSLWLNPDQTGVNKTMLKEKYYRMWYQVGTKLACQPSQVGFEALNEPAGDGAAAASFLTELQQVFIQAFHDAGSFNSQRVIVLQQLGDSYMNAVKYFEAPKNISNPWALTYHYYDPCMTRLFLSPLLQSQPPKRSRECC
jgi:hypothetical protein